MGVFNFEGLAEFISEGTKVPLEDTPNLPKGLYRAVTFSPANFHTVKPIPALIACIDGGNQSLLCTPSICIHLVRIAAVIMEGKKRKGIEIHEYYAAARAKGGGERISYEAQCFPITKPLFEQRLVIDSYEPTMRRGRSRVEISELCSLARRFGEIALAKGIAEKMEEGGLIVLDGNLEARHPYEPELFEELYRLSEARGVIVSSLSKQAALLMNSGVSITQFLLKKAVVEPPWIYTPIATSLSSNHKAEISVVFLHEMAGQPLRLDVNPVGANLEKLKCVASSLAEISNDAFLPGYPYGLVLAHNFAHIDAREVEVHRLKLSKILPKWEGVREGLTRNLR